MGASAPPLEETDSTELIENEEPEREEGYFTRFLEFFYKSDDDDDDEDLSSVKPVSFLELFRFASESELAVIGIACLLSIVSGMCSPAHIYLSGVLTTLYVDVQEPEGDLEFLHLIWSLSSLYGVFFVFTFAVGYVENWLYAWASERIAQRVRSEFIASVLARDAFNDDEASSGELSNRLSSTVDRLKDGIGDNIGTFVRSGSMFFCGSIVSFYLDWKTSLILVWSGPITLVCSTLIPMLSTSDNAKVVDLSEEANGISEEAILNIKTVASCNGEKIMIERYSSSLYSAIAPATRCGFVTALCDASASLLHTLFHVAGTWYGAISYHNGRIEGAGAVFSVVSLAMDSSSSFAQLGSHIMSVIKARAAAAKVYHTIDSSPQEKEDVTEKLDPTQAEMRIGFEDVCYTFPTRSQPVLQNLSFDLAPGKSLALVGQSGCGKSTTLKLLTRFLSADSGRVLLDGLPLERYDKKQWRKQLHLFRMVGVVSQEPSVFNGTIRDNICLGRPFSDEEVTEACRVAYAHEFIMGLEEGYSTLLGPCGVSLSGGQKQRIAIARAIVSNPRLLLLDEATSALDTQSQKTVQEALDAASIGRTTIVVAHRLSTIKNVDRVIVMEEGAIVESSGYDELRTRPDGIFARMVAAQEIEQSDEEAMGPAKMRRKSSESDGDDDDDEEEQEEDSDASSIETIEEETDNDDFPKTRGGVLKLYFFNKTRALLTTALSLLRGVEMPLLGLSYYYVFSSLTDDEYETELFYTMIGTLALGVYSFFIIILSQTLHTYTGESTMVDFRIACFSSLVRRPMAYFDRKETSAASSSVLLSQQPPVAMALVHNSMSNMIENVFAGCAIAVVTFLICIPNGFTGLAYLTIFFSTFYFVEKYSDKAYNEVLAMEIFDNVSTIQQLGVESHFQNRFDEIQMRTKKPLATKIKCMSMVHAINESECMLLDCMATTIGIWFVYQGWIGIKELYATEFCISILGYCAVSMSDSFKARSPPEIIQAKSAARLLFKLIDPTRQEQEGETGLEFYALMSFNPWILSAKIIIPLEALLGIAVNITLLVFLFRSDIGKAARLYRIACMITAALGCYTSLLLLIVQDVPILVNGSVAVVLYGQALFYLPDAVTDLLVVAFVCQCHTMWQTIPAPSIVQWMSLARPESSSIRRLTQAYSIPLLFHANTWYFVRYLIPDPMLRSELVKSIHDLHGTDSSEFHMYGARMIDKGRIDLLDMMLFNAMPSYLACYGLFFFAAIQIRSRLRQKGSTVSPKTVQMQRRFFRTQIAQVLLPLVLLSPPLLLLTAATFFGTNLANLSFLFIYAFWLSPSATGSLLLAFVVTTARKRAVKPIPQSSSKISPIRKATSNSSTS